MAKLQPQAAPLPPEIIQLRQTYQAAQARLVDIIASQNAKGNVTVYREAIMKSVKQELAVLDKFAYEWTNENIPQYYGRSAEKVFTTFRKANIVVGDVAASTQAARIIAANATGQLVEANRFVGRVINDEIRQAGIDAVAEKLTAGDTVKQTKANLIKKMTDRGVVAIRDAKGREISMDAYADLVARSTTREATNRGTMDSVQSLNQDLVQMSQHSSACPVCAAYEGRVYSISGTSTKYPPLSAAFSGPYANIHPNCGHVLTPYLEKLDANTAKTEAFSNRPFDVDDRSQAQREAYERKQREKASLRSDRNQWERYRTTLPDDAPKTFSGFRNTKRADSERWQNLQDDYRSARAAEVVRILKGVL